MFFSLTVVEGVCSNIREYLGKCLNWEHWEHFDKEINKSSKTEWCIECLHAHLAIINSTSSG